MYDEFSDPRFHYGPHMALVGGKAAQAVTAGQIAGIQFTAVAVGGLCVEQLWIAFTHEASLVFTSQEAIFKIGAPLAITVDVTCSKQNFDDRYPLLATCQIGRRSPSLASDLTLPRIRIPFAVGAGGQPNSSHNVQTNFPIYVPPTQSLWVEVPNVDTQLDAAYYMAVVRDVYQRPFQKV